MTSFTGCIEELEKLEEEEKNGLENGDVVTEFKIENLERPNKAIIYPFSIILLIVFGYLNYKRKT